MRNENDRYRYIIIDLYNSRHVLPILADQAYRKLFIMFTNIKKVKLLNSTQTESFL